MNDTPGGAASIPALARGLTARSSRIAVSATSAMLLEAGQARAAGLPLLDFGVGEPDFPTPAHIVEAGIKAIRDGATRYTPIGGLRSTRQAVAEAHARDFGSGYAPDEVMMTVGGKQALFNAILTVVEHGDEVILPAPYWVSFHDQIRYAGATPVVVQNREADGFALSAEAVRAAVTPRTRAMICNSPANPSGALIPPEVFRDLLALCRRRGIWLISDECYARFVYAGRPYSAASEPDSKDWLIVAGSLSKAYGMTGWRVGYALAPRPVIAAMMTLGSHSTGSLAHFTQIAAEAALLGTQAPVAAMLAEYRRRRDLIVGGLRALPGIRCVEPAGAFYAFPQVGCLLGGGTSTALCARLLREAGLVTVPGDAFGSPGHIRFSYATSADTIAHGLERFAAFHARLLN